jgi:hypothetical protein
MKEKEQQESKRKYEEALEKLRKSGLLVEDVTNKGVVEIFVGGVKPPSSVPPQEQNDDDSPKPEN